MRLKKSFMHPVRVHAGDNSQSILMRGSGEFAVKIAVAQLGSAVVQWKFAGITGVNAARIDKHALDSRASPMLAPPGDVVALRIDLCDVRLSPTQGAFVPGQRGPWA